MSDTPIYDQLNYEETWRDEYFGFRQRIVVPAADFGSDWSSPDGHGQIWAIPDESTVSVEILPDTTRFQEVMRVGGRRAGRSAEWDRLVQRALYGASPTPIYDQLRREQFDASVSNMFAAFRSIGESARLAYSSMWASMMGVTSSAHDREYSIEANKLSRSTGWSLDDAEDILRRLDTTPTRKFPMQGIQPYIAVVDELSVRSRSLAAQQNKHYPTSSPSWARKKKR